MQTKISNPMDYKAAFYIRLSKEDDNENESQSVTNQRSMLEAFAEKNRLDVYDTYIDDGWTGTNFDRPDFKRMIADIEVGKVNLVVTKDMSRLGRDYIQTGHYMEKYFPEHRVRYISLLDGIDTGVESTANDITPFKAILNDMYAKDISRKVTSVKRDKQQKGLFIGGKAVYGYKISETEKNTLVIDEEVAPVVLRVFNMALGGMSCRQIAVTLNSEHIATPSTYAGLTLQRKGPYSGMWSAERISDMLQNQTYIGNMVQGKSRKINYKTKKSLKMVRKDWIVVEGTHEPLIDKEVFDKVGLLLSSRKTTRIRTYDFLLKGIIYCRECGYPLGVVNRPNAKGEQTLYFMCRTYMRFTKARVCTSHSIKVDTVTEAVLHKVEDICRRYVDEAALEQAADKAIIEARQKKGTEAEIARINSKLESLTANLDKMYMDKLSGILDEDDFIRVYVRTKEERSILEGKRTQLEVQREQSPMERQAQIKQLVKRFLGTARTNKELIVSLIEKVELTANKQIIIHFRFRQLDRNE